MKSKIMVVAAALSATLGTVHAQSLPDMVGTWTPIETASVKLGEAISGWPATDKPSFNLQPRPLVVVEVQDGRKIAGYEKLANGGKEGFVGVFTREGRLIVSTGNGTAQASFASGTMEWCWTDHLDRMSIVACDVMRKQ